jgi:hypothetical protein
VHAAARVISLKHVLFAKAMVAWNAITQAKPLVKNAGAWVINNNIGNLLHILYYGVYCHLKTHNQTEKLSANSIVFASKREKKRVKLVAYKIIA